MFGANAGSVYSSQYPGVEAGQLMSAQTSGIQAGLEQEQANNTLNVGNYNASMQAFQDIQSLGNTQEGFNAGGVLPSGSPMGVLNQARQLATANLNQMGQQTSLSAIMQNTQANQTINATRSQLLGNANNYTSGLANADITQENAQAKLAWGLATLGASAALGPIGGAIGGAAGSALCAIGGLLGGGADEFSEPNPINEVSGVGGAPAIS